MTGNPASPVTETPSLLNIENLTVGFRTGRGVASMPLQGVNLRVPRSTRMSLVGESGSGKSLTASAVIGMLPGGAEILRGSIRLDGEELIGASKQRLRDLRGPQIAIMFQNPRASLNPVLTVGGQIAAVILTLSDAGRRESHHRAIDLLDQMGVPDARRRAGDYVHQYS